MQAIKEQERWNKVLSWLQSQEDSPQQTAAFDLLGCTPWRLALWNVNLNSVDPDQLVWRLARFLSFKWVNKTQIEAVTAYLNASGSGE